MGNWVTRVVESMGYAGVALLMALENVFPPVPSEVIMPLAGFAASRGELELWLVILVGTLGTLVGSLPWYLLARSLQRERVYRWVDHHGHWLTIERRELERAERWFEKRGKWMVSFGRLVPGVRTLISVPAGFCKMPLWRFLAYSVPGTAIWTGVLAFLGQKLGENYDKVSDYLDPATWSILAIALLVYLVRLVRMRRRNVAKRRLGAPEAHV